uniref:Synaptobrevin, longin-like domain protein n=1 Tax=Tanacetum cinerariifolium TaxID=118510 RepID=A0A699J8T3_TANCI|nr:hypothetical protein [Tanacetum cinerariifolium]
MRLQALIDRKKVIITEDYIRQALQLDDADSVDCLPNEEIFAELARMGYEKPSTKLTFYKAFFSAQWKFLIHIILQCMSAKRTAWNEFNSFMASAVIYIETGRKFNFSKYIFDSLVRNVDSPSKFYMYPRFLQLMINTQIVDLSSHNTKYTPPALIQKVFANMRRVEKGFSGVDTSLFDGMLVPQQAQDVEDATEDEDVINEVFAEPTPPSPTPATPPPPQPEHISSPPHVETAQPSPPTQPQPSQTDEISMPLLNQLLETCATLTKQVANLEQDKVAQAMEITKLKQRVRRLEKKRQFKTSGLKRLRKGRLEESQAKVYHLDLEHADKVLSMQETDKAEPADVEEVIEVVITAKLITEVVTSATTINAATTIITALVPKASAPKRRRGVIIQDPEEAATALVIMQSEVKSKDKGKGILVEEPKPLKRQAQIEQDEAFARELEAELNANINWNDVVDQVKRKERQDNTVMRYQALKRKPVTEAQARKNMMVYLKNMIGFKMEFYRGMTYTKIRPIFKKHYNSIQAFLEKGEKEIEEEGSKRKSESSEQKAAKKQRIDEETEELKTHLQIVHNDEDDVEDLEMLWKLVQERFQSSKPKNFSDDFLLNTLKTMFKMPNVEANIWRNQRGRYKELEAIRILWSSHHNFHNYLDDPAG